MISRAHYARALARAAALPPAPAVRAPVVRRPAEPKAGKRALSLPIAIPPLRVTVADVQAGVAAATRVPLADLLGRSRDRKFVRPRQMAMWLALALTDATLPQVGRAFGRDHSTVLYGRREFARRLATGKCEPRATLRRATRLAAQATEARDWAVRRPIHLTTKGASA